MDDSGSEEFSQTTAGDVLMIEDFVDNVLALGDNISRRFRNGDSVQSLIGRLRPDDD